MQSSAAPDSPTGYLQDAVAGWGGDRCKRRRMLLFPAAAAAEEENGEGLLQGFWNSDDPIASLNCLAEDRITRIPVDTLNCSTLVKETTPREEALHLSSSFSSIKGSATSSVHCSTLRCLPPLKESGGGGNDSGGREKKKKATMSVVYPFAMLKPARVAGDITLKDINRRLLMPPTRPIPHPVGEFTCCPYVSGDGPGLSGKTVVDLTKIHTQGNGTIIIIRTRG